MITLSNGAAAFLRRGDEYLLMKRAPNRKVAPGVWSGVGGHTERDELNNPQATYLREIEEETGISVAQIHDLTLRYIIIRRYRDTMRQTYVYFGETDAEYTDKTDEGKLYWIHENELLNREYTATFAAMLRHYLTTPDTERVIVGVAENNGGKCGMVWSAVEDFNVEA
jgi:8-oxo-dGTP diphosphatase